MKTRILAALKENNTYISGQELCEILSVSRTAVWKIIKQLKTEGYEIEAMPNKGYKLQSSPDLLTESEISSDIQTSVMGKAIRYYEEVKSTNITARALADQGAAHGTLVVAERQTEGKGRRGRTWDSPEQTGIWMSLILKPDFPPNNASMLTLVMGLSVAKAIEDLSGAQVKIKWPNDIVINGKKICGILTEMSAEMEYINHIVIGVGINANTEVFPKEIADIASSIRKETGVAIKRSYLISKIMKYFEGFYLLFLHTCDVSELKNLYNEYLINCGREVKIIDPKNPYVGKALGINDKGELLVQKANGEIENVYAGEVSVRGLYNYV